MSPETEATFASETFEALDAATRAIAGVLASRRVLQLIVERVRDLSGRGTPRWASWTATGRIERFVTAGITPRERERIGRPPQGHGLLGLIIREGLSFRIPDIAAHPDSSGFPPNHPPMHSLLGVPVKVEGIRSATST